MALGHILKLKTDTGLQVEMAPFSREDIVGFAEPLSRLSITKYLSTQFAQTKETEEAWYDTIITSKNHLIWGIWVVGEQRKLIGSFDFKSIQYNPVAQAVNGIVIFNTAYWGKGVSTAVHRASLFYAFQHLGLICVRSAVYHGNIASFRSLEKCGFMVVSTERNAQFLNGALNHKDNLECLSPDDWAWRLWWGEDRPTRKAVEAREVTRSVLKWAEDNVSFA